MVGVDGLAVLLDHQSGDRGEVLSGAEGLDDVPEGELALAESDGIDDALLEVALGDDAGEPTSPDDRQVGELVADLARNPGTVGHLETEDAGAREEQGPITELLEPPHVVLVHHRVDDVHLEAIGFGKGGNLEQLEREEIGRYSYTFIGIRPVGQEEHDAFFALLDHRGAGTFWSPREEDLRVNLTCTLSLVGWFGNG